MTESDKRIPRHLGIIVDGNRRWAKKHGLPAYEGHLAGHNTLIDIAPEFFKQGVEYLTLYVFSTENWNRTKDEVDKLMSLILKILTDDLKFFHKDEIKLRVLGSRHNLSTKIINAIESAEEKTKHYTKGTLAICFNYGGRLEIVDAVKKIIQNKVKPEDVTEDLISDNIYANDIPPVDVVVRTSGEQRLSNFMLWRAAYSEFIFLDKMWPDMTKGDVKAIIDEYARRNRRFGG